MPGFERLPRPKLLALATALAGVFLIRLSEPFLSTHIADVQGGLFASADEASWILTAYTMASFAGILISGLMLRALGLGHYLLLSSSLFAVTALGCALTTHLGTTIVLRGVQGFAAGGFGPAAFFAVFSIAGGPRLPLAAIVLAFMLLIPSTLSPVIGALIENAGGWSSLFWYQAVAGALLAFASYAWIPRQQPTWTSLETDWAGLFLLTSALAFLTLVLSQGTRRFWFDSQWIYLSTCAGIGALAGFVFMTRFSPRPLLQSSLLVSRHFGITNGLNLIIRATIVVTSYLVPQYLLVVHGYRPLESAGLFFSASVLQLATLPLIWWLLHVVDARILMMLGFLCCAVATALALDGTSSSALAELRPTLALFSVGQALFLLPAVVVGSVTLKPAELPTASLAFNVTTVIGSVAGTGLVSHLIVEREKFHSNVIDESVSLYDAIDQGRITNLGAELASRLTDDDRALQQAISVIAASARREAWVLAFNDAFLIVTVLLAIGAFAVMVVGRSPPLKRLPASLASE